MASSSSPTSSSAAPRPEEEQEPNHSDHIRTLAAILQGQQHDNIPFFLQNYYWDPAWGDYQTPLERFLVLCFLAVSGKIDAPGLRPMRKRCYRESTDDDEAEEGSDEEEWEEEEPSGEDLIYISLDSDEEEDTSPTKKHRT